MSRRKEISTRTKSPSAGTFCPTTGSKRRRNRRSRCTWQSGSSSTGSFPSSICTRWSGQSLCGCCCCWCWFWRRRFFRWRPLSSVAAAWKGCWRWPRCWSFRDCHPRSRRPCFRFLPLAADRQNLSGKALWIFLCVFLSFYFLSWLLCWRGVEIKAPFWVRKQDTYIQRRQRHRSQYNMHM